MKSPQTFSVIVETENLGMAGFEDLANSLDSIKSQTFPIKNLKEVVLIVGGHLSPEILETIRKKYPWVKVHMEKEALDYARSKMKGVEVARGDIVIFADSDMRYEKTWLENMIKAIQSNPSGTIVSGDTRLDTISSYHMSLNATWMIQVLSDKITQPTPTHHFPLNNFAIEKSLITKVPIPYHLPLYRNKIPLWEALLLQKGYKIVRAPGTRGHHAPPGTLGDWWYRLLIYGADFVAQMDFSVNLQGKIIEKRNIPKRVFRLLFLCPWKVEQLFLNSYKLLKEDWRRVRFLPLALVLGFANCAVASLGGLIACFNRDFVFHKITARENSHIV